MILWAILHEVDSEHAPNGKLWTKHAVFTSRADAEWFLYNYPDSVSEPGRWAADVQGSVNW